MTTPSKTNFNVAGKVARHVELGQIVLRSASLDSAVLPLDPPSTADVSIGYRARFERASENVLYVYVDFIMTAASGTREDEGGEQEQGLGRFLATFLLMYNVPAEQLAEENDEALYHFAWLNGVHTSWPYWRELVQTASGRAGWPNIVVPVFRPLVRQLSEQHDPMFYKSEEEAWDD